MFRTLASLLQPRANGGYLHRPRLPNAFWIQVIGKKEVEMMGAFWNDGYLDGGVSGIEHSG